MELLFTIVLCLIALIRGESLESRPVAYEYFDDYLLTVMAPKEHSILTKSSQAATQSTISPTDGIAHQPSTMSYDDILGYFRDVPREHWSCCMLGMLAGNKGFHCNAAFYAARVATRNMNRAHNRNLPFHGRDRIPQYGRQIMHTFSRCVIHHSDDFHKCCYAATVERRERLRWQQYRAFMTGDVAMLDDGE
ncbi:hypothetical protein LSH36_10g00028 [Paralvinella palmiformis]|uniref:Uncharacterized protein n=1 Tax=Paralvinella palmiformis TaxID=53620 RepID=A0AAD9NGG2_9ANNE|nr:hypothetical protein LSH36_10g00028 [Paralvinella palmiformis]